MCDRYVFQFDVDKACEDQLVSALEVSPEHPLSIPEASRSRVYMYCFAAVGLSMWVKPESFVRA